MRLKDIEFIQTDFIAFNEMLGGGIPRGRIIELAGPPGSGKTTFALEISKLFRKALYLDFEHESDPKYHKAIGANVQVIQPLFFEEGVDEFFHMIGEDLKKKKRPRYDLLIIDSIGSAMTKAEYEADIADNIVGTKAIKIGQWARKQETVGKMAGVTCIALNHWKNPIGGGPFAKKYSPGGMQLHHSVAVKMSFSHGVSKIWNSPEDKDQQKAIHCYISHRKNKVSGEIGRNSCEYEIVRGQGVSRGVEYLDVALRLGAVKHEGQVYSIGKTTFRGKRAIIQFFDDNPEIRETIYEKWMAKDD